MPPVGRNWARSTSGGLELGRESLLCGGTGPGHPRWARCGLRRLWWAVSELGVPPVGRKGARGIYGRPEVGWGASGGLEVGQGCFVGHEVGR